MTESQSMPFIGFLKAIFIIIMNVWNFPLHCILTSIAFALIKVFSLERNIWCLQ
jgi:hypothetical protein